VTWTNQSINRRVGVATLIVSGGVLLSRILGQVREVIFANLLGASGITDQYVAAFRIPDFLNYLLAGGFLSITFIPIFAGYLATDDEEGGWRALTAIFRPVVIGMSALVVIGWVIAPAVIAALYPDFTTDQLEATTRLTRIVLPAQVFFVAGALFSAVQYAKGHFVVPTAAPVVYNVCIILGGIADAALTDTPGPEGFIWGALVGAIAGNFAIQWWGAARVGMRWKFETPWADPVIAEYFKIALPLMIGQSIVVLDETFMSVFGNRVGEATQTQLQFARRTMLVPVGAVAQAAAVAAYPFLARLFASGKRTQMGRTVDKSLTYVVVLSIGATAALAALSQPTIRVLFQHGAFEPSDTIAAASALFFYAFAVPLWGSLQILTRAFYAKRDMWTPVVIGSAATLVAIPIYFALQDTYGLEGVALASVVSLSVYTATLIFVWYRDPANEGRLTTVTESALRAVPLAAIGGFAAWGAATVIGNALGTSWLAALVQLIIATGVFVGSIFALGGLMYAWFGRAGVSGDIDIGVE